jgi:predicted permease
VTAVVKDTSTIVWLETLVRDTRYGARQLVKTPVFLTVAVLSLALGIGVNTAIFTLIDAVMLQSLPVRDPGGLVLFYDGISTGVYSGDGFGKDIFSHPSWEYLKTHNDSFDDLSAFRQSSDRVTMHVAGTAGNGPMERATVHLVSGNYFDVLGVSAAAGRVLRPGDDRPGAPPLAVMSYDFWRSRFHGDGAVIGKVIVLNGTAFTVAGVAAREFFGERIEPPPSFWIPLSFQPQILQQESSWLEARNVYWLNMMGRLKPGATLRSAEADVNVRLHQFYVEQAGARLSESKRREIQNAQVHLKPGGGGISGLRYLYSEPLHVLMAVVGVVLLIACANIATLMLARASARRQEFMARLSLGASPARLVRQVLTECVLLSVIGGIAGVAFAWWSVKTLVLLFHVSPIVKVRPDPVVLAFTFAISIVTGILFGIIPAIRCSRMEPRPGIAVRASEFGRSRYGSTQALIVLQVALSLVLLMGAGMLAHSLLALERQDVGFVRDNLLVVKTDPKLAGYEKTQLYTLYQSLDERLNALPGVVSASLARYTPESGNSSSFSFAIEGYTPPAGKEMNLYGVEVGPRFFETMGIPLLLGRSMGPRDTPASTPVAVVSQSFVSTYLPNQNPIGRHISLGSPFKAPGMEIVGVVGDSKYYDLRENPKPMAFFSLWQLQGIPYAGELLVRTTGDTSGMAAEVRRMLQQIDTRLPVLDVTTLDHQIEHTLYQQKLIAGLCSVFGVLALMLAAIGIYGTMAYSVARRTSEIGIRMAIGAQRRNVLWMVLRDSLALIAAGLACGLPLAILGARSIKSFLFGVTAIDPLAMGAAVLLIAVLAVLAGYLPARRATKIDPMLALRYE